MISDDPTEVTIDDALHLVLSSILPLEPVSILGSRALGLITSEDHAARWAMPTGDVSTMDGWAVATADLAEAPGDGDVELHIVGESAAGHPSSTPHTPGSAQRISTGALVPAGYDAVIAVEDTIAIDSPPAVRIRRSAVEATTPGRFVRRAGSDVIPGDIVVPRGARIDAPTLAAAAGAGHELLKAHRRPRVAILSTGDELIPIGQTPRPGQTPSTNAPMLEAFLQADGDIVDVRLIPDDRDTAIRVIDELARSVDVIVTTGGNSVGEHDHVAIALARTGAPRHAVIPPDDPRDAMLFRRVRMRPGRPTSVARLAGAWVFALAGNPASTLAGATFFVRPALRRLRGWSALDAAPIQGRLPLAQPQRALDAREYVVRVRVLDGLVVPLPNQASGALSSLATVDALARIPRGAGTLEAGTRVTILPLSDVALRAALAAT
jgi:molybdopterin molybdotransferase